MTVEIWSDVMCPFCYLGKKNFEEALEQIEDSEKVKVEWKSFQLNPNLTNEGMSTLDYLSQNRGMSVEQVKGSFNHLVSAGKEKGIVFDFDKAIIVNTAKAHRLIQLAKEKGLGDEAEEAFFKVYFTDGMNVSDSKVLEEVGLSVGLTKDEVDLAQTDVKYQSGFERDLYEASQIGVKGVPFFVFDRKYAVSGAQPVEVFKQTLEKSLHEWKPAVLEVNEGDTCDIDGNCN